MPFVRVLYSYEEYDVVSVPEGYYGQLTALDGKPMPAGMYIAPAFADEDVADMLNATAFLEKGGYRGPRNPC
ncbi:MAG: hypothetical protein R3D02_07850 [Hyphomicrobiales bacterium]